MYHGNNSEQHGNATLIAIMFIGAVGMIAVGLERMQQNGMKVLTLQETRLSARLTNESAIELLGGLGANYVIVQDKNGLRVGDGAKSFKNNGAWNVVNGRRVDVKNCRSYLQANEASKLYGAANDKANADADCNGRPEISTRIDVEAFKPNDYVVVVASTDVADSLGTRTLKARAQIRIPTVNEFIEDTNLCRFMEPVLGADGGIKYFPDGKPEIRPRRGWADEVIPSYNEAMYSDKTAPNWVEFNAEIAKLQAEGYGGIIDYEMNYDYRKTVPTEPVYNPPKSYAKFAYYLGGKAGGLPDWPGIREPRLKVGCKKTVGDGTPDFCTRVDVHVKDLTKAFTTKKDCTTATDADGKSKTSCTTTKLDPPKIAAKKEQWLCMYFSYHRVYAGNKGKAGETCDRQFRAYCRNHDGCFAPETQITMADGSRLPINEVRIGDEVMSAAGRPVAVKTVIAGPEAKPMYRVGFAGRTVKVTEEHPFQTKDGLKKAHDLAVGDEVLDVDGSYAPLQVLDLVPADDEQMVWNVLLDGDSDPQTHMLIGDGIVSGDLFLQNRGGL